RLRSDIRLSVIAGVLLVLVSCGVFVLADRRSAARREDAALPTAVTQPQLPPRTNRGPSPWDPALIDAASKGVRISDAEGGRTEVAFWIDDEASPVIVGDHIGRGRLWSLSKPVTA